MFVVESFAAWAARNALVTPSRRSKRSAASSSEMRPPQRGHRETRSAGGRRGELSRLPHGPPVRVRAAAPGGSPQRPRCRVRRSPTVRGPFGTPSSCEVSTNVFVADDVPTGPAPPPAPALCSRRTGHIESWIEMFDTLDNERRSRIESRCVRWKSDRDLGPHAGLQSAPPPAARRDRLGARHQIYTRLGAVHRRRLLHRCRRWRSCSTNTPRRIRGSR